jgi:hypothetical protein
MPARRPAASAAFACALRWAAVSLSASLAALGVAGCSAAPPPASSGTAPAAQAGPGIVSTRQAAAVLGRTSATNNKANATNDLRLLRTYETGSALAIDASQYNMSNLAKLLGTKPSPSTPFTIRPLQLVVDGGSGYPAGFLAVGTTELEGSQKNAGSCPHADTLLQYEKSSPSAPWRIDLEPSANEGSFVALATDDGVAAPLTPAERAAAAGVPQRVATDLQDYEVSGHLGPLSAADFDGSCWAIPDPRKQLQQTEAAGLSGRDVYAPAGGSVAYLIAAPRTGARRTSPGSGKGAAGGVLVLFTLGFDDELFGTGGSPVVWSVQPASDPVSVLLPAGHYSSVEEHGDLELAAEVQADGHLSIVGEYAGVTSVKGQLARAPSGPGGTLAADRMP